MENGRTGLMLPKLRAWIELCGSSLSEFFATESGDEGLDQMRTMPRDVRDLAAKLLQLLSTAPPEDVTFFRRLVEIYEGDRGVAIGDRSEG